MKTNARFPTITLLTLGALLVGLAACGKKTESAGAASSAVAPGAPNMEADLAKTLKDQADFYVFKSPADIPADLKWQDGSDLPEFADLNAKKGGTVNFYLSDFPRTLRTVGPDANGAARGYFLDYVEVFFLHPHPNIPGKNYPGLASAWAVSKERKAVFYKIDPKARWSDGKPITTDDVVFFLYMMRSPHLNEPWYNDYYTKNFRQLVVYDKLTFATFHNEYKPDLDIRYGFFAPYPRHAFQDFGPGWAERFQWREVPKTGAYQVREKDVDKGRSITLTRVKDWWAADKRFFRGRYNPDRYHLEVIRDPDKAIESFARGDIDYTLPLTTSKNWYDVLNESHPEVASGRILRYKFFNQIPQPNFGLWLNRSKPLLDNHDIRIGINYATNFDLVCSQYFRGDAVRQETSSDGYGWRMHPTIKAYRFDADKAREYFAKAGFNKQGPDGVLTNAAGQRLSFTITTGYARLSDMLPILKQEALKAGLEFKLEVLDQTTGFKKAQEKNHEITVVALSRSVEMYPRYFDFYHGYNAYEDAYLKDGKFVNLAAEGSPNPNPKKIRVQTNNMTETFIPELDLLIEAYDKAETIEEIKRLAAQIEEKIHEDGAWVNGWAQPFYRGAYWRYLKFPKDFNVAQSRFPDEFFLHWIDMDEKKEVEQARRAGKTWPAQTTIYDKYKTE